VNRAVRRLVRAGRVVVVLAPVVVPRRAGRPAVCVVARTVAKVATAVAATAVAATAVAATAVVVPVVPRAAVETARTRE
jgi:hypothetical protein